MLCMHSPSIAGQTKSLDWGVGGNAYFVRFCSLTSLYLRDTSSNDNPCPLTEHWNAFQLEEASDLLGWSAASSAPPSPPPASSSRQGISKPSPQVLTASCCVAFERPPLPVWHRQQQPAGRAQLATL